jgi:hypothetical protein
MSGVLFLKELHIKQPNIFRYMVFQYFVPERHLSTTITHRSYAVRNVTADKLAEKSCIELASLGNTVSRHSPLPPPVFVQNARRIFNLHNEKLLAFILYFEFSKRERTLPQLLYHFILFLESVTDHYQLWKGFPLFRFVLFCKITP